MTNPLLALRDAGQAVWLDFLDCRILADGTLKRLIADDGLRGLTSNPSIFEKAIGEGDAYDARLRGLLERGDAEIIDLYEGLAIPDIQAAADQLRPVWDSLDGADGYASLEVSPYLAMDTGATIAEARRLWSAVDRPNLMIKVPGTKPGVPAIRTLIADGINVNVTLLFGIDAYLAVADAFMCGLEDRLKAGKALSHIHSVASFFVSRIDTLIDDKIDKRLTQALGDEAETLRCLRGKVAIANAQIAYQHYLELTAAPRWQALVAAGAAPQRLLWASTGTKDKAYSDVLYVETLIGPDTVNTMPPKTMDAFRDHGKVRERLTEGVDRARAILAAADQRGLDLAGVTKGLVTDGVAKFADAFDDLLGAVAAKRSTILGDRLNTQSLEASPDLKSEVDDRLAQAARDGWARRLWAGDASLWTGNDEAKWLGWLEAAKGAAVDFDALNGLAGEVRDAGYTHALLLGMGGSSLGPEVLAKTFGPRPGFPNLVVLDSTDPDQVSRVARSIDPARTLFIVSSKSGSTLEPDVLYRYFHDVAEAALGAGAAGARFIAVTDPGSDLEKTAKRDGFARVFHGDPAIGGRYSVLSNFGMVPAAVLGLDVRAIFETVRTMVFACGPSAPPAANPGFVLGYVMGVAAKAGRDKVTLIASDEIADFGAWLEQLLAESTGKQGKGLIPVDAEPLMRAQSYGADRLFAYLRVEGHDDIARDEAVRALEEAGQPVVRITLADRSMLFQEFFRWEFAVAIAGAVIGINPFDQPDVEASKIKTRALTGAYESSGSLAPETSVFEVGGIAVFADAANARALADDAGVRTLEAWFRAQLRRARPGDYIGLLAYLDRSERHIAALQALRRRILDHRKVATVLGFGPRFLHSTGQAYKGGPNSGVFIQITHRASADLAVPGRKASFGVVEAAEARGDFEVLVERGRRLLRFDLGTDVDGGLRRMTEALERAFA